MIRIFDSAGRTLRRQIVASNDETISLQGLQEGMYFIEIVDKLGKVQVLKVVKRK